MAKKVSKKKKERIDPPEADINRNEKDEPLEPQTLQQKKIAFAQSSHLEAVLMLLKDSAGEQKLVGETEFETIKNAITLEANSNMIKAFIKLIDHIKMGGLHNT